MYYSAYLSLMNQLAGSCKATVMIDDRVISIEKLKENQWVFSTKLSGINQETSSCFSSSGSFHFQQGDISVNLNNDAIIAKQTIRMPAKKYIPFKQHLSYFLENVSQYEEMLIIHAL